MFTCSISADQPVLRDVPGLWPTGRFRPSRELDTRLSKEAEVRVGRDRVSGHLAHPELGFADRRNGAFGPIRGDSPSRDALPGA